MRNLTLVLITLLTMFGCAEGVFDEEFPDEADLARERAVLTLPGDSPGDQLRPGQPISYEVVEGLPVVEGDIVVDWNWLSGTDEDPATRQQALAFVNNAAMTWPNGVVPYVIGRNVPKTTREHIKKAIAHYHANTNIRLVRRTDQAAFLKFVPSDGCRSWIGRIGGPQKVWLSPNCGTAAAIHEIGHAVGLWHEHTRHDRGDHIKIRWKNISPDQRGNFEKYSFGRDLGRYDVRSIMHYDSGAFSKRDGLRTIVRNDGTSIARNTRLSRRDKAGLAKIYPAP